MRPDVSGPTQRGDRRAPGAPRPGVPAFYPRLMRSVPVAVPALVAAVLVLGSACAKPPIAPAPAPAAASAAPAPAPADGPSEQAAMLCSDEAKEDIALALGVDPTSVGPLKYADHTTTCRYAYPNGSFTLVVQDLNDALSTTRAYEAYATKLGRTQTYDLEPGVEAFLTAGGSAVLRKDYKVLLVDVGALPATFGLPPVDRASAAQLVMKAALGCWTG